MQRNPLLSLLMRKDGTPPVWLTALLALFIGGWVILSMQPALDKMVTQGASMPEGETWLFIAAVVALVGAPMMIGVNAAAFTVRHADPANLKKLKLAKLSRAQRVEGYTLGTLHRMQIVLGVVAGLAPALVIGITELMLAIYHASRADCAAQVCPGMLGLPTFDVTHWLIVNGLLVFGVVGFNVLGSALGSWAALTWQGKVIAPAVVVAGMALTTALFVALIGPVEGVPLGQAVIAAVAPYIVAAALVALAGREREPKP